MKRTGTIYLIKFGNKPIYKIGRTNGRVIRRIAELQTGSPEELSCIFEIKVQDSIKIEIMLHERYKNFKLRNEWFQLSKKDIVEIKNLLKKMQIKILDNSLINDSQPISKYFLGPEGLINRVNPITE